jgi:pyridoxine 5-phosphate synthase
LKKITNCGRECQKIGIDLHAGHGLNFYNTNELISIPNLTEVNIGHSIIAASLIYGLKESILKMKVNLNGVGVNTK